MLSRKFLHIVISLLMVTSLLLGASGQANAMPASPVDETKVPHYFGPYPNWANSPQVLANAVVTISAAAPVAGIIGNPLVDRGNATDYATAPGYWLLCLLFFPTLCCLTARSTTSRSGTRQQRAAVPHHLQAACSTLMFCAPQVLRANTRLFMTVQS